MTREELYSAAERRANDIARETREKTIPLERQKENIIDLKPSPGGSDQGVSKETIALKQQIDGRIKNLNNGARDRIDKVVDALPKDTPDAIKQSIKDSSNRVLEGQLDGQKEAPRNPYDKGYNAVQFNAEAAKGTTPVQTEQSKAEDVDKAKTEQVQSNFVPDYDQTQKEIKAEVSERSQKSEAAIKEFRENAREITQQPGSGDGPDKGGPPSPGPGNGPDRPPPAPEQNNQREQPSASRFLNRSTPEQQGPESRQQDQTKAERPSAAGFMRDSKSQNAPEKDGAQQDKTAQTQQERPSASRFLQSRQQGQDKDNSGPGKDTAKEAPPVRTGSGRDDR